MSTALATVEQDRTALAPTRSLVGLLKPIASPQVVMQAQEEVRVYIKETLQEGRDYGTIPGVDKPSMLKPGAERVCAGFGVTMQFEIVEKEVDHTGEYPWIKRKKKWRNQFKGDREFTWEDERGVAFGLYRYVVRCDLVHRETGAVVGSCTGVCSTMESKYCDRPRDAENTVLKMAQKRAMVGAVLTTFGLSDIFTQDVEDMPRDQFERSQATSSDGRGGAAQARPTTGAGAKAATEEMTLEQAKALPLMGKPDKWGGNGGKPIGVVDSAVLEGALKFFEEKAREAEQAGAQFDPRRAAQIAAIRLVLADRAKDQTVLPLDADPPMTPAPTAASHTTPAPGRVQDAITGPVSDAAPASAKRGGKPSEKQAVSLGAHIPGIDDDDAALAD